MTRIVIFLSLASLLNFSDFARADTSLCSQYLNDSFDWDSGTGKDKFPFTIANDGTVKMDQVKVSFKRTGRLIEFHFNPGVTDQNIADKTYKIFLDERNRIVTWQESERTTGTDPRGEGKYFGREVTFYWLDNGKCIPQHEGSFLDQDAEVSFDLQDCRDLKSYYDKKPLLKRCNCANPKQPEVNKTYNFNELSWLHICNLKAQDKQAIFEACSSKEDQSKLRSVVGESTFRAFPVLSLASTRFDRCQRPPIPSAVSAFEAQKGPAASAKFTGRGSK